MPQYMMLIYIPADGPPPDVEPAPTERWMTYTEGLRDAGVHVSGEALQGIETATTVRVREGQTQITDGPFAETREILGGYYVLECPDLDTALQHAQEIPHLHYGSVEVRPVMDVTAIAAAQTQAQAGS